MNMRQREIENKKHIFKQIFAIFLLAFAFIGLSANVLTAPVHAQASLKTEKSKIPEFYLRFPIGNVSKISAEDFRQGKAIPTYITGVYQWMVGVVAILAVVALMVGGVLWMLAGGSKGRVDSAKKTITNALVGLLLALGSYLFLWTISPNLVQFRPLQITEVADIKIDLTVLKGVVSHQAVANRAKENRISCGPFKAVLEGSDYKTVVPPGLASYWTKKGISNLKKLSDPSRFTDAALNYLGVISADPCPPGTSEKICKSDDVKYLLAAYYSGVDANKESTSCAGQAQWECPSDASFQQTRDFVAKALPTLKDFKAGDDCVEPDLNKIKLADGAPKSTEATSIRTYVTESNLKQGPKTSGKLNRVTAAQLAAVARTCGGVEVEIVKDYDADTPAFSAGYSLEVRHNKNNWARINECFRQNGFCRLTGADACNPFHYEYIDGTKTVSQNCKPIPDPLASTNPTADPFILCPNIITK